MSKIEDINYSYHSMFHAENTKKKTETNKKHPIKKDGVFKDILSFEENKANQEIEELQLQQQEIEKLLKEIGIQGEVLKKSKRIEDLDIYKKSVKKFVLSVVELSENAEKKAIWNKIKKEKITKIHLQIIDKELLELTRIFMSEQHSVLEIASKIDKIEGILVDFAT
jgi:uncharacterized protein